MDLGEIRELVKMLESSELTEMEIEEDGSRIRLSKVRPADPMPSGMPIMVTQAGAPMLADPSAMFQPPALVPAPAEQETSEKAPKNALDEGLVTVNSPMVGTFYTSPAPGEPPFVLPGDVVRADQTVCIVEAMKIMNEVAAKKGGVIERVLVENGEAVEFDQPLFAIRPH